MASRGTRYSEEQIIHILKEVEMGTTVAKVCPKHGVTEQTVYQRRDKYCGLEASELQRLRELEAWAEKHGVRIYFMHPGKPAQNAYIERFIEPTRTRCLICSYSLFWPKPEPSLLFGWKSAMPSGRTMR